MFVRDLLISCLRRWYFLLVGLIITGVATYFAFGMVSPTYEAKASVVLIPPAVAVTVGDNPYLYLGGLDQALGVLQVKASSPEVLEPLLKEYPDASISMSKDATTSGPIMAVSVSSDNPEETMTLLQSTLDLIPTTLASLQKDLKVPVPSVITSMPLSIDVKPSTNSKKQIQLTAIAAVGGLAATLLITGFIDRLMSRTKKGKKRPDADSDTQPLGPRLLLENEREPVPVNSSRKTRKQGKPRWQEENRTESDAQADVGT